PPRAVFGMLVSAQALIVSMFGGRGSAWGAAIGAAFLVPLSEWLHGQFGAALPGIAGAVYGLAIILVVLLLPQGISWSLRDRLARRSTATEKTAPGPVADTAAAAAPCTGAQVPAPASGANLLEVEGIHLSFGGVRALRDVTFTVRQGEILGIIGPNGAG